ncbi:MAG: efflux RND transporter permease subunit [candidate division KSB1 bacterium]|nr:efflux RND transporter permease subunit [candidate division KSB1 bacterium]
MRLPHWAIEHHQFTLVIVLILAVAGVFSFLTMPRAEDPAVTPPGASVIVIYPGASPSDVEQLIVEPVERALNELQDVKRISAAAEDGIGTISVEFFFGVDPEEKYAQVVQKINAIRNELPEDLFSIELYKWTITDVNILQLALVSEESYHRLEKIAEDLQKRLDRVSGVGKVEIWALPRRQVRIAVDLAELAAKKLPLSRVTAAVASANQTLPGGYLDIGRKRFSIQLSGAFTGHDDIRRTVVHAAGGKTILLQDIADVSWADEDPTYLARVNGRRAVYITVQQKPETNIFKVRKGIETVLRDFSTRELPSSVELVTVFDQSISVASRLNSFFISLLQGLFLVGLVMTLSVSLRASLIVMTVIPLSVLIGITLVDLYGYGLQQMTIAGLIIALGMLVDNAIVVTVNAARFLRLGVDRLRAPAEATAQVGWAIAGSTVTTVLAFLPMMLMKDKTGDYIRSMPLIVICTLSASLLLALTFTPFLCSRLLKTESEEKLPLHRLVDRFVETIYRRALKRALQRPKRIVAFAAAALIASLALFPLIGISFFPKAEKPQFMIDINTPPGTNLQETDRIAREVEKLLAKTPQVLLYAANIGHGNPRIYYNVFPKREHSTHAQIFVRLKSWDLHSFYALLEDLRRQLAEIPGAKIEVKEFEQGPPVDSPLAVRISGDEMEVLKDLSQQVEDVFRSVPEVLNINNPLAWNGLHLYLRIDREQAGRLGVPIAEINRTVRLAIAGATIGRFRNERGESFDIVIRLPQGSQLPPDELLERIFVPSLSGKAVPLKSVATLELKSSPPAIRHYGLKRVNTLSADVAAGASVDRVTRRIWEKLQRIPLPPGYTISLGGEWESRGESFSSMTQSILLALLCIFAVLVLEFRSAAQPFIVFSAIPLSLIGALWALFLSGNSFSFTAFIGLTSLVGIVVNNSIILVDYTNQLREQGREVDDALQEAGETRFLPVFLTTATTIGGLLPLAVRGGTLWAPMSWTLIGGLTVSTALTLLVTPALYKLFSESE